MYIFFSLIYLSVYLLPTKSVRNLILFLTPINATPYSTTIALTLTCLFLFLLLFIRSLFIECSPNKKNGCKLLAINNLLLYTPWN